ncbi:MAG: hypothetical protein ABFD94_19370 [Armatimonadia bacterium]
MTHFSDGVRAGRNFANNGTASEPGVFMSPINVYNVVPATLSATAVAAAQAVAGAGNLTINGASASGGVATLDVPRAVSVVSSNAGDTTQTATVFGTDAYGIAMSEAIAFNGTTTVAGQKAFKTVTRVAISAAMAGNASVGSTDIFGLPYRVDSRNYVITAWNGAIVTTGTFAAADTTSPATTTTNDVRGTFLPADAANGS